MGLVAKDGSDCESAELGRRPSLGSSAEDMMPSDCRCCGRTAARRSSRTVPRSTGLHQRIPFGSDFSSAQNHRLAHYMMVAAGLREPKATGGLLQPGQRHAHTSGRAIAHCDRRHILPLEARTPALGDALVPVLIVALATRALSC